MRKRGRPEFKSEIVRRVQALLPFACPNLRLLSERELRHLERYLTADREPDCQVIGDTVSREEGEHGKDGDRVD